MTPERAGAVPFRARASDAREARGRSLTSVLLLAGLLAIAGACRSKAPSTRVADGPPEGDSAATTLGPNDVVHVGVYGHPELSSPDTLNGFGSIVDPEGRLNLPLVGGVPVEGLTLGEAANAVTEALGRFVQEPRVHVTIVEWSSRRFYVYGEVTAPGAYVLDRPLNAYQGLSLGGGFTRYADREAVWLLRPERDGDTLRYIAHAIDGERPADDGLAALRPEDVLFVRRTGTGRFADEVLPILTGISSSLSSVATVLLIEDRLED